MYPFKTRNSRTFFVKYKQRAIFLSTFTREWRHKMNASPSKCEKFLHYYS